MRLVILMVTLIFCVSVSVHAETIPKNAFTQGENWFCQNGFKADRINNKCLEMIVEEKNTAKNTQELVRRQRNHTLEYYGKDFTLKQVERKCEVYRYSDNYGDLGCRSFRFIERKYKAYFSGKNNDNGEIECRGSDLRPLERYCTVSMFSENHGDTDC